MKNPKLIAPVAVALFAVMSAFGTHSMNSSKSSMPPTVGWERHGLRVCTNSMACKTEQDIICTSPTTGLQLFAKDATGDCIVKVYKP